MKANRVTANNLELPADRELALYASGDEQKQRIKQIRANAIQEAKQQRGNDAAEWQKRAFNALDKAFVKGFYEEPTPRANAVTSNDQVLDFEEWRS